MLTGSVLGVLFLLAQTPQSGAAPSVTVDPTAGPESAAVLYAAEHGDAEAQVTLGLVYEGVGSLAQANSWYLKAAEQGHAGAQFKVGFAFLRGNGAAKDPAKGVEWLRKAAEQGDDRSQFIVAEAYAHGKGVPKDAAKAVEWYAKAASQGNEWARTELGRAYMKGAGVAKDKILAYAWLSLAGEPGVKPRKSLHLAPDELAEAQRISSSWKAGQSLAREMSAK